MENNVVCKHYDFDKDNDDKYNDDMKYGNDSVAFLMMRMIIAKIVMMNIINQKTKKEIL